MLFDINSQFKTISRIKMYRFITSINIIFISLITNFYAS